MFKKFENAVWPHTAFLLCGEEFYNLATFQSLTWLRHKIAISQGNMNDQLESLRYIYPCGICYHQIEETVICNFVDQYVVY